MEGGGRREEGREGQRKKGGKIENRDRLSGQTELQRYDQELIRVNGNLHSSHNEETEAFQNFVRCEIRIEQNRTQNTEQVAVLLDIKRHRRGPQTVTMIQMRTCWPWSCAPLCGDETPLPP